MGRDSVARALSMAKEDGRCLVFWGLEPEEEQFFINFVKDFEDDPIPDESQEVESTFSAVCYLDHPPLVTER